MKLILRFLYCLIGGIGIGLGIGFVTIVWQKTLIANAGFGELEGVEENAHEYLMIRAVEPNKLVDQLAVRARIENTSERYDFSAIQTDIQVLENGEELLRCSGYTEDELKALTTQWVYLTCHQHVINKLPDGIEYRVAISGASAYPNQERRR